MKFGVVGYGVVGRHMWADITRAGQECLVYDKFRTDLGQLATPEQINTCEAVFVCVSTPSLPSGACDISAVLDVFSWLNVPVAIIRSTVPPGTVAALVEAQHHDRDMGIVFCPEFIGEGVNPPYLQMSQPPFVILGGDEEAQSRAAMAFGHLYSAECEKIYLGPNTAELLKYAENFYLAMKVTWANEMYLLAEHFDADYLSLISALGHDYRIGRDHFHVDPAQPGWAGRCFPKDLAALLSAAGEENALLLSSVIAVNDRQRKAL